MGISRVQPAIGLTGEGCEWTTPVVNAGPAQVLVASARLAPNPLSPRLAETVAPGACLTIVSDPVSTLSRMCRGSCTYRKLIVDTAPTPVRSRGSLE